MIKTLIIISPWSSAPAVLAANRRLSAQLSGREISRSPEGRCDVPAPVEVRERSLTASPPFPLALAVSLFSFLDLHPELDQAADRYRAAAATPCSVATYSTSLMFTTKGVNQPRSTKRWYLLRSTLPAVYLRPPCATISRISFKSLSVSVICRFRSAALWAHFRFCFRH